MSSYHRLTAPFVAMGTYAHPNYMGPFPFSYPPDGAHYSSNQGLNTRFSRGAAGLPEGMVVPAYLLNIPFTPSPDIEVTKKKWTHLTTVIREQSFGATAAESEQGVKRRIFVNIGINRARSLNPTEDRAVLEWARTVPTGDIGFPCRTITTLWQPSFLFQSGESQYPVDVNVLQPAFLVLEYLAEPKRVQEALLTLDSDSFRKQIPFTHIREWIKEDTFGLRGFNTLVSRSPTYLSIMDDDPVSFRAERLGLFSGYDSLIPRNQPLPQLMSTGYFAPDNIDLGTKFAIAFDMEIREAVAGEIPLAFYPPEPNTCVLLSDPDLRTRITYVNSKSLDTENRRLVTNLRPALDPRRVKFVVMRCLSTAIPKRMCASRVLRDFQVKHLGQRQILLSLKGVSQTHADVSILSNNIFMALNHKGVNIGSFKRMFAPIFQCFDPIALAYALPRRGNYSWKHFQFLMRAYPKWDAYFSAALASPHEREAHKVAWGLHAEAIADKIWRGAMTAQAYEDGFQAYLERCDSALEELGSVIADYKLVLKAARAAGNRMFCLFEANVVG